MRKIKMELVWHNCKTCPPSEEYNEDLLLWDGYTLIQAEWDNGSWFCGKHYLDMVGEEEMCWWADLNQTANGFFRKDFGDRKEYTKVLAFICVLSGIVLMSLAVLITRLITQLG